MPYPRIVLACLLAVSLAACATARTEVVAPRPLPTNDAFIRMFEGGCYYATCTTYEIDLHPDGSYTLNGLRNVRTSGITHGALGPDAWAQAEAAFAATHFAAMPEAINGATRPPGSLPCMPDAPACASRAISA